MAKTSEMVHAAVARNRRSVEVEARDWEVGRAVWTVPARTSRNLNGRHNHYDGPDAVTYFAHT